MTCVYMKMLNRALLLTICVMCVDCRPGRMKAESLPGEQDPSVKKANYSDYAFLISAPVENFSQPSDQTDNRLKPTKQPVAPPRSAWQVPRALGLVQAANKSAQGRTSEDYVELVEVPRVAKVANTSKAPPDQFSNVTGFYVENDAPGSMLSVLSGFSDLQTLFIACFATLLPLLAVLLVGFGIRCIWRRTCPHLPESSDASVEAGDDDGACDADDDDGDEDGDGDGEGEGRTSPHSSDDTDDADDRRRGQLEPHDSPLNDKPCPGYCLMTSGHTKANPAGGNRGASGGRPRSPVSPPHLVAASPTALTANGSITTMTLKNNHLIVETEERNDIKRSVRETKMTYSPESEGVFVVEVQQGTRYEGKKKSNKSKILVHREDPPSDAETARASTANVSSSGYCYGSQLNYGDAYRGHLSSPPPAAPSIQNPPSHTPRTVPDLDKPVVTAAIFKQDSVLGSDANLSYNIEGSSDGPLLSDVQAREISLHILQEKKELANNATNDLSAISKPLINNLETSANIDLIDQLPEPNHLENSNDKNKIMKVESPSLIKEDSGTLHGFLNTNVNGQLPQKDDLVNGLITEHQLLKKDSDVTSQIKADPIITSAVNDNSTISYEKNNMRSLEETVKSDSDSIPVLETQEKAILDELPNKSSADIHSGSTNISIEIEPPSPGLQHKTEDIPYQIQEEPTDILNDLMNLSDLSDISQEDSTTFLPQTVENVLCDPLENLTTFPEQQNDLQDFRNEITDMLPDPIDNNEPLPDPLPVSESLPESLNFPEPPDELPNSGDQVSDSLNDAPDDEESSVILAIPTEVPDSIKEFTNAQQVPENVDALVAKSIDTLPMPEEFPDPLDSLPEAEEDLPAPPSFCQEDDLPPPPDLSNAEDASEKMTTMPSLKCDEDNEIQRAEN